jgi:hypothetical protein
MPRLGINLGFGVIGAIINASLGAFVLLLIIRLVRSGGRWGSGSRIGWSRRMGGLWQQPRSSDR